MIIRNFLFHRVDDETDAMWPPVKPQLFTEIIKYLTQNYTLVALENYLRDPGAFSGQRKIATVSFDDGYKDNVEVAAPLLTKLKCPASFYVVTDCIDKNIPTWTYIIDNIFQNTRKERIELPFDFAPEKFRFFYLRKSGEPNPVIREIKPWLKKLDNPHQVIIMQSLMEQCNDVAAPAKKMMSWDDVRQLEAAGFIIGSHSHTHPMLASLKEETEITNELRISGQRIQQELGKFPLTISYPIGSLDERVIRLSSSEGYRYGLAVEQRFFDTDKDDEFKIPRVELYQEPWWKVRMRISGMFSRVKKLIA